MSDYRSTIITNLKALRQQEQQAKEMFKVRAYNKAIKSIEEYGQPIVSYEQLVEAKLEGLGKGLMEKIKQIIEDGFLERTKDVVQNNAKQQAIEMFSKIMAVGPVKANALVNEHNINTIEELRAHTELLNDKQKLGLEYYEDFNKRIPRKEMDVHAKFLTEVIARVAPQATFDIAGSYRRGAPDSGDIDVLFTLPADHADAEKTFQAVVTELKKAKYLKADFAFGGEKYMGVCKLPKYKTSRRIDLMYIPTEKYAFALLYFTGSQSFNIKMRHWALSKGLSLSEHGFKDAKTNMLISMPQIRKEEDVFKHLEMEWVPPTSR